MNTKWMTIEKNIDSEDPISYTLYNLDTIWRVRVLKSGQVELVFINGKVLSLSGLAAERFILGYLPSEIDDVPIQLSSGYLAP